MSKSGVILLIEDDIDDRQFLENVFEKLEVKNERVWFENTNDAQAFLSSTSKSLFIIFCDVNLPGRDGLEFKRKIDDDPKLRKKSIPFIFYSTTAYQQDINQAYTQMTIQGFFKKGRDAEETLNIIRTIVNYWALCKHPNTQ